MKQNKKIKILVSSSLSLVLLNSCAGPESYQDKMARYNPQNSGKNLVPEIKISKFEFKKGTPSEFKGRMPSSVQADKNQSNLEDNKEVNPTNKKLYFLSLYSEYESMKKYALSYEAPSVSICPNFHTSLVRHNEAHANESEKMLKVIKKFSYDSSKFNDELYVSSHPELQLPLSKEDVNPRVIDLLRSKNNEMNEFATNELVHKALDIHLAKTYSEIRELCEYGVSDNYYIYENLITHIKSKPFTADNANMNILLKTTIFSNIALESSLQKHLNSTSGRTIASITNDDKKSPYTTEVMTRLNVSWAKQYFDFIKESH